MPTTPATASDAIGTGRDRYLMADRPSEGSRATRQALDDQSRENIATTCA